MHRALALLFLVATLTPATLRSAPPDFASAQSVEAFRVAPCDERYQTKGRIFRGQKIIAGPRLLARATSHAIIEQLQRLYGTDRPPTRCAFVARYGLRVRLATETVDVLVCPHCGEVEFFARKRKGNSSVSSQLLDILLKTFSDYPLHPNEV
jgi:hypothetical protein